MDYIEIPFLTMLSMVQLNLLYESGVAVCDYYVIDLNITIHILKIVL